LIYIEHKAETALAAVKMTTGMLLGDCTVIAFAQEREILWKLAGCKEIF